GGSVGVRAGGAGADQPANPAGADAGVARGERPSSGTTTSPTAPRIRAATIAQNMRIADRTGRGPAGSSAAAGRRKSPRRTSAREPGAGEGERGAWGGLRAPGRARAGRRRAG